MKWSYGITTTPKRRYDYLPETISSLAAAGFPQPHLFVDGADGATSYEGTEQFTTLRESQIGNFGNWYLSAMELYLTEPMSDFYAIFEDDLIISRNARLYIEQTVDHLGDHYLNLFTNGINAARACYGETGWIQTDQNGQGAVGLVFPNRVLRKVLGSPRMVDHPWTSSYPRERVDGEISAVMRDRSVLELCHIPSIIQHVGTSSLLGHSYPPSPVFRGEDFDLLTLIGE